jgi:hypothetical protein
MGPIKLKPGAKLQLFYDKTGHIVSIVEVKLGSRVHAGVSIPNCRSHEVTITKDMAKNGIMHLHMNYEIDVSSKEPRLRTQAQAKIK